MHIEKIKKIKNEIIKKNGEWTAHNIKLAEGIYTLQNVAGLNAGVDRIIQIVEDLSNKVMSELRVADLGCLEGGYAVELARMGADVVGIEGKTYNYEKAVFAKRVLALNKLNFYLDDVRNFNVERYGTFDVILCLGLLYHLNSPDLFVVLENITRACSQFLIIDTHISIKPIKKFKYKNMFYYGRNYIEFDKHTTQEQKDEKLWAALDNNSSVWLTKFSLINYLNFLGFSSVYECYIPSETNRPIDRITLVAIKGRKIFLNGGSGFYSEKNKNKINLCQRKYYSIIKFMSLLTPIFIKKLLKKCLKFL